MHSYIFLINVFKHHLVVWFFCCCFFSFSILKLPSPPWNMKRKQAISLNLFVMTVPVVRRKIWLSITGRQKRSNFQHKLLEESWCLRVIVHFLWAPEEILACATLSLTCWLTRTFIDMFIGKCSEFMNYFEPDVKETVNSIVLKTLFVWNLLWVLQKLGII